MSDHVRYFVPRLGLGTLLPRQAALDDKFGGVPWGFPRGRWPRCSRCREPMSFIAQLSHAAGRLDLGAPGRVLHLFRCDKLDPCPSYEGGAGANAGLVLEADELASGPTALPHPEMAVYPEARVIEWLVKEDGVPPERFDDFFSEERHPSPDGVPEDTKLGSVPLWFQSAEQGPPKPWRFVLQIDSEYRFEGPPPHPDDAGCVVQRQVDGEWVPRRPRKAKPGAPDGIYGSEDSWSCSNGLSGGLDTLTYVFVRTDGARAEAWFFWQAT